MALCVVYMCRVHIMQLLTAWRYKLTRQVQRLSPATSGPVYVQL